MPIQNSDRSQSTNCVCRFQSIRAGLDCTLQPQQVRVSELRTTFIHRSKALQLSDMAAERSIDPFEWGDKVPDSASSYISMRYQGEWFRVGDCAEFRSEPHYMPYVGKIYRLYEGAGGNMVRVRWFFRARELPRFCLTVPPATMNPKEVFIALGHVKGVENENKVVIIRSIHVLASYISSSSVVLSN